MPFSKSSGESANLRLIAGAALITWACATANEPETPPVPDYQPTAGTGGRGGAGGSAGAAPQTGGTFSGTGGTPPQTGGSASGSGGAVSGRGGTGGVPATGGAGAGGKGGSAPTAGTGAGVSGLGNEAGNTATGGTPSTGGAGATGGGGAGGSTGGGGGAGGAGGTTGGSATGGNGGSGGTLDPNWRPPDMSTQDLVILYTNEVSATMGREIRFNLRLKNNTAAAVGLSTVTIRYWMSAEPAPRFAIDYAATGLRANSPPTFVTNGGNSYVEFSFGATGSVIPYVDNNTLEQTRINVRIDTTLNTPQFNQSNDWSFDGTSGQLKANAKITAYDGDTLIFGCEPSQTCAEPSAPSGEGGAGG